MTSMRSPPQRRSHSSSRPMGKRKLHELHYYQCDWTGLNMDQSYCYMPAKSGDKED